MIYKLVQSNSIFFLRFFLYMDILIYTVYSLLFHIEMFPFKSFLVCNQSNLNNVVCVSTKYIYAINAHSRYPGCIAFCFSWSVKEFILLIGG